MLDEIFGLYTPPVEMPSPHQNLALEARVDALELACAGLWELLKTKSGYSDEELVSVIKQVDARDGLVDGRTTPIVGEVCPKCGKRLLTRKRNHCVWCGAELTGKIF